MQITAHPSLAPSLSPANTSLSPSIPLPLSLSLPCSSPPNLSLEPFLGRGECNRRRRTLLPAPGWTWTTPAGAQLPAGGKELGQTSGYHLLLLSLFPPPPWL